MDQKTNIKKILGLEKGGIHFYVGVSVFLLAYIFQKIYGDSLFILMQYLLGLWITVWAMYIGPCFPAWIKYERWWKIQRSISLIGTSIATIFFLIGIIGKTFFG